MKKGIGVERGLQGGASLTVTFDTLDSHPSGQGQQGGVPDRTGRGKMVVGFYSKVVFVLSVKTLVFSRRLPNVFIRKIF